MISVNGGGGDIIVGVVSAAGVAVASVRSPRGGIDSVTAEEAADEAAVRLKRQNEMSRVAVPLRSADWSACTFASCLSPYPHPFAP